MLNEIIEIAEQAGAAIMEIYADPNLDVQIKADKSPLTAADTNANEAIISGLKAVSTHPILTEESYIEYNDRRDWTTYWLVDPLDGTKNFVARDGEFTVNIALIDDHAPVLGVVYAPVQKLIYAAEKSKGAFLNGDKIFNTSERTDLIAADSTFHSTDATLSFLKKHNIKEVKRFGSALKLCKLAEGVIDVYPRLNGTCEWDTAAAHIIANEAGCKLIDVDTAQELRYNKEQITNNHFIASRNDLSFVSC